MSEMLANQSHRSGTSPIRPASKHNPDVKKTSTNDHAEIECIIEECVNEARVSIDEKAQEKPVAQEEAKEVEVKEQV